MCHWLLKAQVHVKAKKGLVRAGSVTWRGHEPGGHWSWQDRVVPGGSRGGFSQYGKGKCNSYAGENDLGGGARGTRTAGAAPGVAQGCPEAPPQQPVSRARCQADAWW